MNIYSQLEMYQYKSNIFEKDKITSVTSGAPLELPRGTLNWKWSFQIVRKEDSVFHNVTPEFGMWHDDCQPNDILGIDHISNKDIMNLLISR